MQKAMQKNEFSNEWSLLQNQFDSYEKYSLLIKLFSIGLFYIAYLANKLDLFILTLVFILWFQDAIWKTFQSRIESRLLVLEKHLSCEHKTEENQFDFYQFNRQFLKNSPSNRGKIREYLHQSIRPTIAFPHAILILILLFKLIF